MLLNLWLLSQPGCFCARSLFHSLIGLFPCQSHVLSEGAMRVWQCASVATFNQPLHGMIHHDSKSSEPFGRPADSLNGKHIHTRHANTRNMQTNEGRNRKKKKWAQTESDSNRSLLIPHACPCSHPVTTKDESLPSDQFSGIFWIFWGE